MAKQLAQIVIIPPDREIVTTENTSVHYQRLVAAHKIADLLYFAQQAIIMENSEFPDIRKLVEGILIQIDAYREGLGMIVDEAQEKLDEILEC